MTVFRDEDQFDTFTAFWNQPGLQAHIQQMRECLGCTVWQAFIAMRPRGVWWDEGNRAECDAEEEQASEAWRQQP